VGEVATVLSDRERAFAGRWRRVLRAACASEPQQSSTGTDSGTMTGVDGYGDVFLVIDGWTTIRSEYD